MIVNEQFVCDCVCARDLGNFEILFLGIQTTSAVNFRLKHTVLTYRLTTIYF